MIFLAISDFYLVCLLIFDFSMDIFCSPYPEEGLEFVTLWCRYVNTSVNTWTFQFRDYPQLALDIREMTVWGRLIGSEIEGARRGR